jgi:hypothetical protein
MGRWGVMPLVALVQQGVNIGGMLARSGTIPAETPARYRPSRPQTPCARQRRCAYRPAGAAPCIPRSSEWGSSRHPPALLSRRGSRLQASLGAPAPWPPGPPQKIRRLAEPWAALGLSGLREYVRLHEDKLTTQSQHARVSGSSRGCAQSEKAARLPLSAFLMLVSSCTGQDWSPEWRSSEMAPFSPERTRNERAH